MERELGLSSIGIFAVANKFPAIITMLFSIFSVSWTVSAIEEYRKPNFEDFNDKIFRVLFGALTVCSLVLILLSKEIIYLLTAPDFHEAYKYMVILIIGSVLSCMSSFWGTCFSIEKQSKYFFYSSLWGALTAIALNYLLIPCFAIYGAAVSVAVSFMVTALARFLYCRKFLTSKSIWSALIYTCLLCISTAFILIVDNGLLQVIVVLSCIITIAIVERKYLLYFKELVFNRIQRNRDY